MLFQFSGVVAACEVDPHTAPAARRVLRTCSSSDCMPQAPFNPQLASAPAATGAVSGTRRGEGTRTGAGAGAGVCVGVGAGLSAGGAATTIDAGALPVMGGASSAASSPPPPPPQAAREKDMQSITPGRTKRLVFLSFIGESGSEGRQGQILRRPTASTPNFL